MKETAVNYHQREIQRAVFDRLTTYRYISQEKNGQKKVAIRYYKRILMTRWISALNQQ